MLLKSLLSLRNSAAKNLVLNRTISVSSKYMQEKQPDQSTTISQTATNVEQQPKTTTNTPLNEDDWFKKILKPNVAFQTDFDSVTSRMNFATLKGEEKMAYIESYYECCKERGDQVPKELTPEYMEILMRTESYSHLKKTIQ